MNQWYSKPFLGTTLRTDHWSVRGLIGLWVFNEGAGGIVKNLADQTGDTDGMKINMANPGTPSSGWTAGRDGSAIAFDGTNDYVVFGQNSDFNFSATDNFSVVTWVKLHGVQPESFGDTIACIIGKGGLSGSNPGFCLYVRAEKSSATIRDVVDNIAAIQRKIDFNDGKWHFIAMTVNRGLQLLELFSDGISDGTVNTAAVGSLSNADQQAQMGQTFDSDRPWRGWHLDGEISNSLIYNRALSAAEVNELYMDQYVMFQPRVDVALLAQIGGVMAAQYYRRLLAGGR